MQDLARASGELRITLFDSETGVLHEIETHNLVTNAGLNWFAQAIARLNTSNLSQMAIGVDGRAPQPYDSALFGEVARSASNGGPSGASFVMNASFAEGAGTGSICEFGLFTSDGTLVARSVIPPQNKSSTTTMQVAWTITLQSA